MKCTDCGTVYPAHYDKCPKCKSSHSTKLEYAVKKRVPVDNGVGKEKISAFIESAEIKLGDLQ